MFDWLASLSLFKKLLILGGGLVAIIVLIAVATSGGGDDAPVASPTNAPATSQPATASEPEEPAPTVIAISEPRTPDPSPIPEVIATPDPTPDPTPMGPVTTFSDGTFFVGTDIEPGTYRNSTSAGGCYWERLAGFSGDLDELIANGFVYAKQIVTISPTDAGFSSDDCGIWTLGLSQVTASLSDPFGDGMYAVGVDIAPGTWRNDGQAGCYWERLSGFSGTIDDVLSNEYSDARQIVEIAASDSGFSASDCGTWTMVN